MNNEFIFCMHCIFCTGATIGCYLMSAEALMMIVVMHCVLSNLFILKQVMLFSYVVTCADPFTIGATVGLNLLQEFYGKKSAQHAIKINILLMIFYVISCAIHLFYVPSTEDYTHPAYQLLLQPAPRLVCASLITYAFVQTLDFYLYGFLKNYFFYLSMTIRNFISIALCQAIDTIMFTCLGLWGHVAHLSHVIFVSYLVKLIAILIAMIVLHGFRKIKMQC